LKTPRKANPFWLRRIPPKNHDITLLRPPTLEKSKRFETRADASAESLRSEAILKSAGGASLAQQYLCECRAGYYHCENTYCPICARDSRRWFIAEVLRVVHRRSGNATSATALLAASSNIEELNPSEHRHSIRKKLGRAGLGTAHCVGGFEIVYRARDKCWVLHINLLILGGNKSAVAKLGAAFATTEFDRPCQCVPLRNVVKQISYLLKFSTYHRPFRQTGSKKSPAKPLNGREHVALVNWFARYRFSDMMFLYGLRREGDRLVTTRRLPG
jgi:hypothetical protein